MAAVGLHHIPDRHLYMSHSGRRIILADARQRLPPVNNDCQSEIALGEFDYLRRFPLGNQRRHFTAKPTGNISFQEFALNVWLPHMQTKLSDSTTKDYYRILTGRIFPHLGFVPLKDIRPEHLDQLTIYLKGLKGNKGTLSPRRTNIILLRVRQVLDLAFEREYLDKNPHSWISLQEERRPRVGPFSFEERATFLAHVPEPEYGMRKACPLFWRHYFIVAFDTGMRPSEQMALRWFPDAQHPEKSSYVDFVQKKIFIGQGWVRGKETHLKTSGSYREIDMLSTVQQALEAQQQGVPGLWVFPNANGGRLNLDNLRHRVWHPTLQRAGLRPRDLYQCRHTFASLMLQAGEEPAWVARMMGHTTTKMLYERYHRFIQNRTRRDGDLYLQQQEA
jgi:integrase